MKAENKAENKGNAPARAENSACRILEKLTVAAFEDSGAHCFDVSPGWLPRPKLVSVKYEDRRMENYEDRRRRFHPGFVLKIHLSGDSWGYVDNKFYHFTPGSAMLVFPFQLHYLVKVSEGTGQKRIIVDFSLDSADERFLSGLRNCLFEPDEAGWADIDELVCAAREPQTSAIQRSYLALCRFLADEAERHLEQPRNSEPPRELNRLQKCFDYLYSNYLNNPSLKEIAADFKCSESGLRKLFLRETGRTPAKFIRELRLLKSAEMLKQGNASVREIALFCGFTDQFTFSRAFKRHFGFSPVSYRGKI